MQFLVSCHIHISEIRNLTMENTPKQQKNTSPPPFFLYFLPKDDDFLKVTTRKWLFEKHLEKSTFQRQFVSMFLLFFSFLCQHVRKQIFKFLQFFSCSSKISSLSFLTKNVSLTFLKGYPPFYSGGGNARIVFRKIFIILDWEVVWRSGLVRWKVLDLVNTFGACCQHLLTKNNICC